MKKSIWYNVSLRCKVLMDIEDGENEELDVEDFVTGLTLDDHYDNTYDWNTEIEDF